MYIIDKSNNKIKKIPQKTFHELGFKERPHLRFMYSLFVTKMGVT
jgi:hypothetical protein